MPSVTIDDLAQLRLAQLMMHIERHTTEALIKQRSRVCLGERKGQFIIIWIQVFVNTLATSSLVKTQLGTQISSNDPNC